MTITMFRTSALTAVLRRTLFDSDAKEAERSPRTSIPESFSGRDALSRSSIGGFLAAALVLGRAAAANAEDAPWHWTWVTPTEKGWVTVEGDAAVTLSANRFFAHLKPGAPGYSPDVRIEGRLANRKAEALVTLEGTDASPETYTGKFRSIRSKLSDPSHGWGSDRISLIAGSSFLGFYREVQAARSKDDSKIQKSRLRAF
jgi:hypothetical protein